jgi:hypothetical protein
MWDSALVSEIEQAAHVDIGLLFGGRRRGFLDRGLGIGFR